MMLVGRPDDEVAVVDDGVVSLSMKDTCRLGAAVATC